MPLVHLLYSKLPVWTQHLAVSTYGIYWYWLRFGPGYQPFVRGYKEREFFTKEQWKHWQKEKLKTLLSEASQHIPYYRNHWTASQKKSAEMGELKDIPLLEKAPIRENPKQFLRTDLHPCYKSLFFTSGSTGTPLNIYYTLSEYRNCLALRETRSAHWAGVSFRLPRATFSGRPIEPDPNSPGPFYRFNVIERQVYFSSFHLRPHTVGQYIHALRRHRIQWITGYTVSIALLAQFALERKLPACPLKAVITTSEKLTPAMREVIQKYFHCPVFEEYSTVENALFVSECEKGKLHVNPDAGEVEILRSDGTPCESHEVGEVVTTSLIQHYQPFIRFRLGDLASWDDQPCSCGRSMPVMKEVVGRIEDIIVGPDGRKVSSFYGIAWDLPGVRESQIVQEAIDHIILNVVPSPLFTLQDEKIMIKRMQQRLASNVRVTVNRVDFIPRTAAGKFKAVVSKIKK